jgi:uncharacterized protein with ParB-like and HNH nuclease domain
LINIADVGNLTTVGIVTMIDNLLSFKALVTERVFKIPDYQRGYAWTKDQRQDLLEDLEEIQVLRQASKYEHYTGTIVLEDTGQQKSVPVGPSMSWKS